MALILPDYPALGVEDRRSVERDVTRYVAQQIHSMPSFLRLPYRLALFGFEALALLRYGRPFRALPPAKRAAYLAYWNDAPIAPMRDVVKLIRSVALLVYFDHALVTQRLEAERQPGHAVVEPHHAANE